MTRFRYAHLFPGFSVLLIGLICAWEAAHYELGSLRFFGPGAFPLALAVLLMVIGIMLLAMAVIPPASLTRSATGNTDTGHPPFPFRAMLAILGGMIAFTLLVEWLGLFITVMAVILIASLAESTPRFKPLLLLSLGMAVFCVLVFITLLGLPMPIFPE